MWYAEAKAKIDIPLKDNDFNEMTNSELIGLINRKRGVRSCAEFSIALQWLGDRNYKEAIRDCENKSWLKWAADNLKPIHYETIKAGERITITRGMNEKYALLARAIFDLPEDYVGEILYQNQ